MNNIKCPHCGTVFTINETEYSQLLAQVRSSEFDKEIHERLEKEKALLEEKSKNDFTSSYLTPAKLNFIFLISLSLRRSNPLSISTT